MGRRKLARRYCVSLQGSGASNPDTGARFLYFQSEAQWAARKELVDQSEDGHIITRVTDWDGRGGGRVVLHGFYST